MTTLVFIVMTTTDLVRADGGNTAVAVGLTLAGMILTGATYTGTSVNSAISTGNAVASNNYTDIWVFWVAPIVGGIVASLSCTFVFSPYKQPLYPGYKISSIDEATNRLLHHDGPIVVPKNYFKEH